MKKILTSLFLAVATGVILLGVHVASGLGEPSTDPNTAGLTAPTFSGADIQGAVRNSVGNLNLGDDTDVTGKLMINNSGDITSTVDSGAIIVNHPSDATKWLAIDLDEIQSFGADLYLNRDSLKSVHIGQDLDVDGAIYDSNDDSVNINDKLSVSGDIHTGNGNIDTSNGTISAPVGGVFSTSGNISTSTGNVGSINGNVLAENGTVRAKFGNFTDALLAKTLTAVGDITSAAGNIIAAGNLNAGKSLFVTENANVAGFVTNPLNKPLSLEDPDGVAISGDVSLADDLILSAGNITVNTGDLNLGGSLSVGGDLNYTGHATAKGFGTVNISSTGWNTLSSQRYSPLSIICPTAESTNAIVLDCGFQVAQFTTYYQSVGDTYNVELYPLILGADRHSCVGKFYNSSPTALRYAKLYATCWYPEL